MEWLEPLASRGCARLFVWTDAASGLRALTAVDDLRLGPAAGGVRTQPYPSLDAALDDVTRLARAMTQKCALGGLAAGGCKTVVLDHPELRRAEAFAKLGTHLEELGGMVRTAGDLGTGPDDLAAMASTCSYVHTDEGPLADSVAHGLLRCVEAARAHRGESPSVAGLRVAVQGCGAIGAAVARRLHREGARLLVSDLDDARARALARELAAEVIAPDAILRCPVDLLSPCARGGLLDEEAVAGLQTSLVVGGANNILTGDAAAEALVRRGVLFVPDVISSAGAVVDGIAASVMGISDRGPLLDALGDTAREVLAKADEACVTPVVAARTLAEARLGG